MPTMRDIALLAGVSQGTVSNVLNKRENVSMEKILLVEEAARKLGYSPNQQAKQLRSNGMDRSIAVILPNILDSSYARIYSELESCASEEGYACTLHLTNDISACEESTLLSIASNRVEAVFLVSCMNERCSALDALEAAGTSIIYLIRHPAHAECYISFPFSELGQIFAEKLAELGCKNVVALTGLSAFSTATEFSSGFINSGEKYGLHTSVITANLINNYPSAFSIASAEPSFDGIAVESPALYKSLSTAYAQRSDREMPWILSLRQADMLPGPADAKSILLDLDYGILARKAFHSFLKSEQAFQYIMDLPPISKPKSAFPAVNTPVTLNVLMLDSPATLALRSLLPDFRQESGIDVNLITFPYNELYRVLNEMGGSGVYDVIRMDSVWLPWFARNTLLPIDVNSNEYHIITAGIAEELKPPLFDDNQTCYAFPFDPSVQMLFYRKDLFDDLKVRRQYYESTHQDLEIPSDFVRYNQLLRYFSRSSNPFSPIEYGATLSSGTISGIVCEFLPRLFAFGGELFNQDGKPIFNSESGCAALENYLNSRQYACPIPQNSWWKASLENFISGRTAMLNLFVNHAANISDLRLSKVAGAVGWAATPGGGALRGGGMLGISRGSKNPEAALQFIEWTCSERLSVPFTLLGGVSPCASIYTNSQLTSIFPWLTSMLDAYRSSHQRTMPTVGGTLLEEQKFEHILGQSIVNTMYGMTTPKQALDSACSLLSLSQN